jgi:adenosylhomocysteine nucleosidase
VILVCAATGTEAAACRQGIADSGALGLAVLTTGVGPERAAAALARRLADRTAGARPNLVVSSGFAGALTPGLEALDWITASAVHRLEDGRAVPVPLPPGLLRVARGAVSCRLVSAERVVAAADGGDVPALGAPAAVDMESAALAEVSAAAGIPFLVLRLVTDTPGRPLGAVARSLAAAMGARGAAERAVRGARAALDAAREPLATARFVRSGLLWRSRLRAGWREYARLGVPTS